MGIRDHELRKNSGRAQRTAIDTDQLIQIDSLVDEKWSVRTSASGCDSKNYWHQCLCPFGKAQLHQWSHFLEGFSFMSSFFSEAILMTLFGKTISHDRPKNQITILCSFFLLLLFFPSVFLACLSSSTSVREDAVPARYLHQASAQCPPHPHGCLRSNDQIPWTSSLEGRTFACCRDTWQCVHMVVVVIRRSLHFRACLNSID